MMNNNNNPSEPTEEPKPSITTPFQSHEAFVASLQAAKKTGGIAFKDQKYEEALYTYGNCIRSISLRVNNPRFAASETQIHEIQDLLCSLHTNLAVCYKVRYYLTSRGKMKKKKPTNIVARPLNGPGQMVCCNNKIKY